MAKYKINEKNADRRLRAVQLRGEELSDKEIAEILETTSNMVRQYRTIRGSNKLKFPV